MLVSSYKNYQHYLNDGWSKEPKKMFQFLIQVIAELDLPEDAKLLDIGCATGELIHYLNSHFPKFQYTGTDVFDELINECKQLQPNQQFLNADVKHLPVSFSQQFDLITVVSVISIFSFKELDLFWDNLFRSVKPGGYILVLSPFNEYGIDCEITHRKRMDGKTGSWEKGWNIFSLETMKEQIAHRGGSLEITPFVFDRPLATKPDPIRTWTMSTEKNPHQLVNGLKLMVDHYLLKIKV